ncbi:hypothetical protein JW898_03070 [Candidatus Woesearchaeota archaeon]|nr:hypothetical protein [Candidatus Woesearchaeota archaeon]
MDDYNGKALLVLRPQVLAKISDLREDNGMSPLVIPQKKELSWTPEIIDIAPGYPPADQGYGNRARQLILPNRDLDGTAKFVILKKKTAEVRSLQRKIERELGYDEAGGLARWANNLVNETKKRLGIKVRTLEDLFEEEQQLVQETHSALSNIYLLCTQNQASLNSFLDMADHKLDEIAAARPSRIHTLSDTKDEFDRSMRYLSGVQAGTPGFGLARSQARWARNAVAEAAHAIDYNDLYARNVNMFATRLDLGLQILITGTHTVHNLGGTYEVAAEFLKAWPAFSTIRNLFKYFSTFREVNDALGTAFEQARQIESKFENPSMLARIYHEMPTLQPDQGMPRVLDNLNRELYLCGARAFDKG